MVLKYSKQISVTSSGRIARDNIVYAISILRSDLSGLTTILAEIPDRSFKDVTKDLRIFSFSRENDRHMGVCKDFFFSHNDVANIFIENVYDAIYM